MEIIFYKGPHQEIFVKVNQDATPYSLVQVQHQDTNEMRLALEAHSDTIWKELERTNKLGVLVRYGDDLNEEKVKELYQESFIVGHLTGKWQVVFP